MPISVYNDLIAEFDNKIKISDYSEAYRIYDLRCGLSMGREWKASVFFVLALGALFVMMIENFDLASVPTASIVILISMYMCTHYVYLLPRKAKLKGEHIYKSSGLLSKQKRFKIYRDHFIFKNEYEYLKRYYTELSDCIETDDCFVLIGGTDHKVTVISKSSLEASVIEKLSEHFSHEMIRRYRRAKSKRK